MKFSRVIAAAALAVAAVGTTASAQAVNFVGSTDFCWVATGVPICPAFGSPATIGDLSVSTGAFNVTTFNGFAAIGGGASASFGQATLGVDPFNYAGFNLLMRVQFSAPTATDPQTYSGTLFGSVLGAANGGVQIAWMPATFFGTYGGPNPGNYSLTANNLALTPGQMNIDITGFITATPTQVVPEPASYALIAAGFAGMALVARRRTNTFL